MLIDVQMTDRLKDALRAFHMVEQQIVALDGKAQGQNGHLLVQLRRQLVMEFARLGTALEEEPCLIENPELMTRATRLLAAFRTRNAINQADWPVIRVRDNPAQYRIATQAVVASSHAFWDWLSQDLNFRR